MAVDPDVPPEIARQIDDHTREAPHLSEAQVRAIVQQELADGGGDPPGVRIPLGELKASIEVDRLNTWGPNRTSRYQLRCFGSGHNFADGGTPARWYQGNARYSDGPNGPEVLGWPMEDGERLRHGVTLHRGRKWLTFAGQWTGEGYTPDKSGLVVGPGANDPMTGDGGPRGDFAGMDTFMSVGTPEKEGPVYRLSYEGVSQGWQHGPGHHAGPFGMHSPQGAAQSGPVTTSTQKGEVIWWSKHEPASPITFPGRQPLGKHDVVLGRYPIPPVGEPYIMLAEWRVPDHFALFSVDAATGAITTVAEHGGPFGYHYDPSQIAEGPGPRSYNDRLYPILGSIYVPHAYAGGPPWNWLQASNVRRVHWSHITITDLHSLAELASHARSF